VVWCSAGAVCRWPASDPLEVVARAVVRLTFRSRPLIEPYRDCSNGTELNRESLFPTRAESSFPCSAWERPGTTLRVARAAERPGRHSHAGARERDARWRDDSLNLPL
jgi:hypothetical protein